MNIPSNLTIKEFVKYYLEAAPKEEIEKKFYQILDELEELRSIAKQADRIEERLREQLSFGQDLVSQINTIVSETHKTSRKNSKDWQLAKTIIVAIEDSYFET